MAAMKGSKKVAKVMGEYKAGTLHSGKNPKGPKKAPIVKSKKQAVAIAMSESGLQNPKASKGLMNKKGK